MTTYVPSQKILKKYAHVLVNYALNSGKGVKKGEVVHVVVPDIAKPLAKEIRNAVLEAGGHPLLRLTATGLQKDYYNLANKDQLTFFPHDYLKEKAKLIDHQVVIIADPFPYELKDVDPKKIFVSRASAKPYKDWLIDKEHEGDFTWTIAMWGVKAKADIVNLNLEEYWQEIIKACYLDLDDPIAEWKKISQLQQKILTKMNNLDIDYVTVEGEDMDLKIGIGSDRQWKAGGYRNIPSFEVFTSPDWRRVEGQARYNEPLYRFGNVIQDISLEIKDGVVVKAKAKKGDKFLQQLLKAENGNKIGEFSLTDARMSRITHPMAETLFDENIGGKYGNTHIALGMSYKDTYKGDSSNFTKKDWDKRGFNDCVEHTDIVSTTDRKVIAHLKKGGEKVIYEGGQFVL